jgi:TolB protein
MRQSPAPSTPLLVALATCALGVTWSTTSLAGDKPPDAGESLQVVVGPGGTGLDPLAVPEVRCTEGAPEALCRTVAEMLRRDLTLSFIYAVIPSRSYLVDAQAEPLETPNWSDWNNIGARWLVKAEVKGRGPWDVEFRLFNVVDKTNVRVKEQTFKNEAETGVKRAVHRFCNGVLEARTGTPGVFDTKIAYSVKVAAGVKSVGTISMDGLERAGIVNNGSINTLPAWGFGSVIYTSFIDGKPELFFGRKKLTRDDGHYRKVAVSPDGSKMVASISYGGQSDLFLLSPDGSVQKNLTNSDADEVSPTFSPDGGEIAFVSNQAGSPQIFVMSAGGGGMRRLTHAGSYNYSPDWGKNGLIVFAGMEDGASDIFTVSKGGEIRRLTQDQGFNKDPSWSPDGRYVTFVSTRSDGSGIYIMSADGRYQLLVAKGGGYGNTAWER